MKFVICDDEVLFLSDFSDKFLKYMQKNNYNANLRTCNTGEELLDLCKKEKVDVIFLDIDMPSMNGFQVAKNIRIMYSNCIIVFCSSHNELVYDSFEYEPFWFLCKANYGNKLDVVLEKVIEKIQCYNKEFVIKIKDKLIKIMYQEILYFVVVKHKIHIHKEKEILEYRCNLVDVEKQVCNAGFIKVNSGCIVNLDWIYKIQGNELILKNKELLVISRSNKKSVRDTFFSYLERK